MFLHWREIPRDLPHLVSSARDVYAEPGDAWPALFQVLSYGHVLRARSNGEHHHRKGTRLTRGYLDDVSNDEPPSPA
ncbi:MAG: hypothetical protein FJ096_06435 [Deltaproteobacteria bacterium]|nr:hypothetical protein [Deltaproteobacteria bacterium]